jgi:hypothetical protein
MITPVLPWMGLGLVALFTLTLLLVLALVAPSVWSKKAVRRKASLDLLTRITDLIRVVVDADRRR